MKGPVECPAHWLEIDPDQCYETWNTRNTKKTLQASRKKKGPHTKGYGSEYKVSQKQHWKLENSVEMASKL